MILVVAEGETEAVRIIDGLIAAAEHEEGCGGGDRLRARRWRRLADAISDGLEAVTQKRQAGSR